MASDQKDVYAQRMAKAYGDYEKLVEKAYELNQAYKGKLDDDSQVSALIKDVLELKNWRPYLLGDVQEDSCVTPFDSVYVKGAEIKGKQQTLSEIIKPGSAKIIEPNKRYMMLPNPGNDDPQVILNASLISWQIGKYPLYRDIVVKSSPIDAHEYDLQINGWYAIDSIVYDGKDLNLVINKPLMEMQMGRNGVMYTEEMAEVMKHDNPMQPVAKANLGNLLINLNVGITKQYVDKLVTKIKAEMEEEKAEKEKLIPKGGWDIEL